MGKTSQQKKNYLTIIKWYQTYFKTISLRIFASKINKIKTQSKKKEYNIYVSRSFARVLLEKDFAPPINTLDGCSMLPLMVTCIKFDSLFNQHVNTIYYHFTCCIRRCICHLLQMNCLLQSENCEDTNMTYLIYS